jgi:hypothetical protein
MLSSDKNCNNIKQVQVILDVVEHLSEHIVKQSLLGNHKIRDDDWQNQTEE